MSLEKSTSATAVSPSKTAGSNTAEFLFQKEPLGNSVIEMNHDESLGGQQKNKRKASEISDEAESGDRLLDSLDAWKELGALVNDVGRYVIQTRINTAKERRTIRAVTKRQCAVDQRQDIKKSGKMDVSSLGGVSPSQFSQQDQEYVEDSDKIKKMLVLYLQMKRIHGAFRSEIANVITERSATKAASDSTVSLGHHLVKGEASALDSKVSIPEKRHVNIITPDGIA